jgi:hypothetical protein
LKIIAEMIVDPEGCETQLGRKLLEDFGEESAVLPRSPRSTVTLPISDSSRSALFQPLSEFLICRLCEESIKIVLTEVTDNLFTSISGHTHASNSIFITSTRY